MERAKQQIIDCGYVGLEILITEWNTQTQSADKKVKWVGNESINRLVAGAMVCHFLHASDHCSDAMGWWVASDVFEEGGPQLEAYGNRYQHYGMLTIDGLPKASYHAFSFMNRMRGKRYAVTLPEGLVPTQNCIVTDELSATRALIWNTWFPFQEQARNWPVSLELPLPASHTGASEIRLTIAHVRKGRGSAFEYWQAMGAPANLTRVEQSALAVAALPDYRSTMAPVRNGTVYVSLELGINEFAFVEIGGDPAGQLAELSDEQKALNQSLMLDCAAFTSPAAP
jgi:beta-xylosidase